MSAINGINESLILLQIATCHLNKSVSEVPATSGPYTRFYVTEARVGQPSRVSARYLPTKCPDKVAHIVTCFGLLSACMVLAGSLGFLVMAFYELVLNTTSTLPLKKKEQEKREKG